MNKSKQMKYSAEGKLINVPTSKCNNTGLIEKFTDDNRPQNPSGTKQDWSRYILQEYNNLLNIPFFNYWDRSISEWDEDIRCRDIPLSCDRLQTSRCPITCNMRATNYINTNILSTNNTQSPIQELKDNDNSCWSMKNQCNDVYGNCNMNIVNMCPKTCNMCYIENAGKK